MALPLRFSGVPFQMRAHADRPAGGRAGDASAAARGEARGQRHESTCSLSLVAGKPPLVLVHGFGSSPFTWRHVTEPLGEDFRLLVPDLVECQRASAVAAGDYSLEGHLRRLEDLLRRERLEKAAVVGNSYGGTLALFLASREPDRVSRLVLIAPAWFVEQFPLLIKLLRSPILGPLSLHAPPRWVARFALRRAFARASRIPSDAVQAYARRIGAPAARRAWRQTALAMQRPNALATLPLLSSVRQPTLILWGEEDRILPPIQGRRLQSSLPNATLVMLENVGHAPQEERPEAFLEAALPFLTANA